MKLLTRFRKAAALPFVLLLVALNVVVVVALLVYATTELQASRNSGQAEVARALAQSGIDIAAGLIAANSTDNGFVSYQRIVTNVSGDTNPRLETKIANVAAGNSAMPWNKSITNPAVLHSGFASGTGGVDLNFGVGTNTDAGFIAPRTNLSGWTNLSTNMFRMEWIYVYKGDSSKPENLVGRVAYWVDDESSKLNVNYSGHIMTYATGESKSDTGKWTDFQIKRPDLPGMPMEKNFEGRKWPLYMELGGVANLTTNNAYNIISQRGTPKSNDFIPYPSVLAVRLGTVNKPGGPAVTTLSQQSALGFTATVYTKENERTYATGKKRHDLLRMYSGAPISETISNFQTEITANYPEFNEKYDLAGYAAATYSLVQQPGYTTTNKSPLAGTTYGTSKIYSQGLPLVNEVSILASVGKNNGTNVVDISSTIELIILGQSAIYNNGIGEQDTWGAAITNKSAYVAEVNFLPTNTAFGLPLTNVTLNGAASINWFKPNRPGGSDYGPVGPIGTNSINTAFSGSISSISSNLTLTNSNSLTWVFPTNVTVSVKHNNLPYQTLVFVAPLPTNSIPSPVSGTTNVVYHLVAQPDGDINSYRGDPRFGILSASTVSDPVTSATNPQASIGSLNFSSWNIDKYDNATNQPDLAPAAIFFAQDYGIPQYVIDKLRGFGASLAGVGFLGEVPVTTKSGPALAWSTPRLWGDGRPIVNGTNYPPDWLLLDCFHMAAWPSEAEPSGTTNMVFSSYGRVNVNGGKPFFQVATNVDGQSSTVFDSITFEAKSKDFTGVNADGSVSYGWKPYDRANNYLRRVKQMVTDRTSTNKPYLSHYEFLARLAETNMYVTSIETWHPWSGWWPSPIMIGSGSNNATNTTDRRIEGIVRSLAHKLTTHGNQFSIFSLAQALQVSGSGASAKTNVVGEAYLQAVYERAPEYNEATGAITNGSGTGAPPMRQLYLRELRY